MLCQILDRVRIVPSAAESFLAKVGLRNFKDLREKRTEKGRIPRITFSEDLVPDAESSFVGLADIEVANNHAKSFGVAWPMRRNTT